MEAELVAEEEVAKQVLKNKGKKGIIGGFWGFWGFVGFREFKGGLRGFFLENLPRNLLDSEWKGIFRVFSFFFFFICLTSFDMFKFILFIS